LQSNRADDLCASNVRSSEHEVVTQIYKPNLQAKIYKPKLTFSTTVTGRLALRPVDAARRATIYIRTGSIRRIHLCVVRCRTASGASGHPA